MIYRVSCSYFVSLQKEFDIIFTEKEVITWLKQFLFQIFTE